MKQKLDYIKTIDWHNHLKYTIQEDFGSGKGSGDHSSNACFGLNEKGTAKLRSKENGIIAGMELLPSIFNLFDKEIAWEKIKCDGDNVENNEIILSANGPIKSLLGVERIILNYIQRLSGIATLTNLMSKKLEGTNCKLLDTRKTTPGWRYLEKYAVRVGGGHNHRMGLYDYIMLKDNHIDYCGSIKKAVSQTKDYLDRHQLKREIEVEVRNLKEVKEAMDEKYINRIMLDNFSVEMCSSAVEIINGEKEIEISGGIDISNIRKYALSGIDFISSGSLTHSAKNLDLNFKADI